MSGNARQFAGGAAWLYGYRWLGQLLDFAAVIVLARLLTPEDFGIVAIAASFIVIIEGLAALDVNKALIRSRDTATELYDTAWTLSILRGLLAALILIASAALVKDTDLSEVLYFLALSPLLSGAANPRFVLFERDMHYSRLAIVTIAGKLIALLVAVALAYQFRNYWALIASTLVGVAITTVLTYVLKPYRPQWSLARFNSIFEFSGWLSLVSIVNTLTTETDKLIVGKLLGNGSAGLYFMTQRLGVLPTRELVSPVQRILFPAFSQLTNDRPRLKRIARESINVLGAVSLPAGCGFAWIAADFVGLVLGDKWLPIVPLLQILTPYLGFRATLSMTLPCMMALGETRLLFKVSSAYALVHLPLFIWATAEYGLTGAFWGIVSAGVLYTYLNAWMLKTTLGIGFRDIATQLQRPLLALTTMLICLWLCAPLTSNANPAGAVLAELGIGAISYSLTLLCIWKLNQSPNGFEQRILDLWLNRSS